MVLEPLGRKRSRRKVSWLPQPWSARASHLSPPKSGLHPLFFSPFWRYRGPPPFCLLQAPGKYCWNECNREALTPRHSGSDVPKQPIGSLSIKLTPSVATNGWLPTASPPAPWVLDADFKSILPLCPRQSLLGCWCVFCFVLFFWGCTSVCAWEGDCH